MRNKKKNRSSSVSIQIQVETIKEKMFILIVCFGIIFKKTNFISDEDMIQRTKEKRTQTNLALMSIERIIVIHSYYFCIC